MTLRHRLPLLCSTLCLWSVTLAQPTASGLYLAEGQWATWAQAIEQQEASGIVVHLIQPNRGPDTLQTFRQLGADTLLLPHQRLVIRQRYQLSQAGTLILEKELVTPDKGEWRVRLHIAQSQTEERVFTCIQATAEPTSWNPAREFTQLIRRLFRTSEPERFLLICNDSIGLGVYAGVPTAPAYQKAERVETNAALGEIRAKFAGNKGWVVIKAVPLGYGRFGLAVWPASSGSAHFLYAQVTQLCAPDWPYLPPHTPSDPLAPENFDRRRLIYD